MAPGLCPWASSPPDQPVGCPRGKRTGAFHTKPDLAWTLIKEAREAKIPFRLVVADSCLRRKCASGVPVVCGAHPVYHGGAAQAGNLAVGRGSQAPASLLPGRSGESACPIRPGSARCVGRVTARTWCALEVNWSWGT